MVHFIGILCKMFSCPRCNYSTKLRPNLGIHFNRKNPCKNVNGIELSDDVKERAMCKVNATQNATAKNIENATNTNDINGSHNTATSNSQSHNTNTNSHNTNITLNINNLAADFPILLKYENLYRHFCGDMPDKKSIDAKKKRLFGRAIRELDKFQYNEKDGKIPQELKVKEIITMIRSLLAIPPKKKQNPKDIIYNTMALYDDKKRENYFYDTSHVREKPSWKNHREIHILERINPMICAIERNTIKLFYQTWENQQQKDIILDRMRRLYKIILCLELNTNIMKLDAESFVNEILDVDEDDTSYASLVQSVKDRDIVNTCKRIYGYAKEDLRDDEDDLQMEVVDIHEETQRITESVSKIIHKIFQQECSSNPKFLEKMNDVHQEQHDIPDDDIQEEYEIKYTTI